MHAAAATTGPAAAAGKTEPSAWRVRTEWLAYAAAFLVWLLYVVPARGGWERDVVPIATASLLPTILVLRPWRLCSRAVLAFALAPAVGSLVVAGLSPHGDGGPISLSRWGYFGGLLLATAAFARTPQRRAFVAGAVLLAGLLQFSQAWLPWWGGGGSVDGPMLGTIYSANPFGSLMLGLALAAAGIAVLADAPLRRLGLLVAPLCASGVVLSGARAAMLLMVAGVLLLAGLGLRGRGWRGLLRCASVVGLTWGVLAVSTSSVFFTGDSSALQATTSKKSSGQTLDSTTAVRLDYWQAAWGEFVDHPAVGGGSGSYMGDSRLRMPAGAERSPFAHNEVLGSLAEGGLTLGLPVLLLLAAAVASCGRLLLRGMSRAGAPEPVRLSMGLAAGGLMAHSMLDFALSFPAILALLGILLGASLTVSVPPARAHAASWSVVGLLVITLSGTYLGWSHDRAGVSSVAQAGTSPLPGVRDARVVVAEARRIVARRDRDAAADAADDLRNLAPMDGNLEALRLDLLDLAGREGAIVDQARRLALLSRDKAPLLLVPYAQRLPARAGADLLLSEAYRRADEPGRIAAQLVDLVEEAHRLAGTPEPGWTCARRALQRSGALADDILVPSDTGRGLGTPSCARWAVEAATPLGDLP